MNHDVYAYRNVIHAICPVIIITSIFGCDTLTESVIGTLDCLEAFSAKESASPSEPDDVSEDQDDDASGDGKDESSTTTGVTVANEDVMLQARPRMLATADADIALLQVAVADDSCSISLL